MREVKKEGRMAKDKIEKASNQERQAIRQFLTDKGVHPSQVNEFLSANDDGKNRGQMAIDIISKCKEFPKQD